MSESFDKEKFLVKIREWIRISAQSSRSAEFEEEVMFLGKNKTLLVNGTAYNQEELRNAKEFPLFADRDIEIFNKYGENILPGMKGVSYK